MIINHCHVFPSGTLNQQYPELGTINSLLEFMEKCKIEKVVAFAPYKYWMPRDTFYKLDVEDGNEWLYENIKHLSNIYGVIAGDPREKNACWVLERFAQKGFIGVKIHPACLKIKLDDPVYDEYYTTAEKLGLIVIFHTGVHGWLLQKYEPILIDNIAYKHPNLKIIIEHMGIPYHLEQALAVVHNSKFFNDTNVYAGITGLICEKNKDKLFKIIEIIGSDRIIYGLDFPQCSLSPDYPKDTRPFPPDKSTDVFKKHLEILHSLKIGKEDLENILGNTIERIIRNNAMVLSQEK